MRKINDIRLDKITNLLSKRIGMDVILLRFLQYCYLVTKKIENPIPKYFT